MVVMVAAVAAALTCIVRHENDLITFTEVFCCRLCMLRRRLYMNLTLSFRHVRARLVQLEPEWRAIVLFLE